MNLKISSYSRKALFSVALLLGFGSLHAQSSWKDIVRDGNNFNEIQKDVETHFKKKKEEASKSRSSKSKDSEYDNDEIKYRRWEWYMSNRLNPDGTFPDVYKNYMDYRREFPTASQKPGINSRRVGVKSGAWTNVSQTVGDGGYSGMGRANDIAFHPTDPNTFFVCTDGGGLWRTTDGGITYDPLTDDLPVVKVNTVAIDPNNPDVMYIGINEQIYWSRSLGIYKTTNGGATWAPTGISYNYYYYWRAINELVVSNDNSNRIVAATSQGLKVSEDAGVTWTTKVSGQFISVKNHASNDKIIYAALRSNTATNLLYKSTDGGSSWTVVENNGLTGFYIKDMQVTPANDNYIAVSTQDDEIYRSTDGGNNFSLVSDMDGAFVLSGIDPDNIYYGWMDIFKSTDNGQNYTQISKWHGGTVYQTVHADQRGVRIHPLNPHLIYWCNDGGVFVYNENTEIFTELSNGIISTQFYRMDCSQTNSILIGGTQDNGGRLRKEDGNWKATNGGDAMVCKIDNTNPDVLYSTYIYGELKRSTNGWLSAYNIYPPKPDEAPSTDSRIKGAWVTPYVLDPSDNSTIVIGYHDVYRSTDRGTNWTRISNGLTGSYSDKMYAIAVAPSNSNVIYASHDKELYKTSDLGANWVTTTLDDASRITSIEVHPTDPNTIWATSSDFYDGKKVFKSTDGGATWTNISLNLPNFPVSDVTYVKDTDDMLIIATDVGPFYKDNTMEEWARIGDNFPNCVATEVVIQYHTGKVFVSTYGRGIWEADIPTTGNQKPEVVFENFYDGMTIDAGSDITVSALATDDVSVASASLYLNDVLVRTITEAPYKWNTAEIDDRELDNLTVGSYKLELVAVDNEGVESDPAIVTIKAINPNNIQPDVSITDPADNQLFEGLSQITFTATAADTDGSVDYVTFLIDGQSLIALSSPYSVTWTPSVAGTYTVQAIATDNEGLNSETASVAFVVEVTTNPECDVAEWSSTTVYATAGTKVKYEGKLYENKWHTQGNIPGDPNGPWKLIGFCEASALDCSSASEWSAAAVYSATNTLVRYNGDLYANQYYSNNQTPGVHEVWVYQGPCMDAPFAIPAEKPAETEEESPEFAVAVNDYKVYPNPSYGLFYFTMESKTAVEKVNITITNLKGTLLLNRVYTDKAEISDEFDLRDQPIGLYILKIESSDKVIEKILQIK